MTIINFKLTRVAKAGGGDRYEHGSKEDADFMVIYIPQTISRKGGNYEGSVKETFTVTFD